MSNRKSNFARAHNISLPSTKRKLNIDEATSALSSMGYRMGTVRHSLADKTSYWSVTTPTGSVVEVAANKLTDFVYGKIKNLNAQRYTETTYEVLFPDEDEDTQFIDSKEAAIKVARQYAAKGCTVELSQVTKTWRSKSEADAAQIPTNTKETPMRFFKGLNMNSTGTKAKFGDYYNNPADSSKKVNKLLPRIVAAIKAAGGQVDSVEKHESKSSASIRFPTKGDYQVSIDIGSTYLAVNRYVIRGAGVLQSVHLFNGELSDIDKAVAIAVNEWKKLKAARRHFSRTGAKELHMKKSTYAVVHPSIAGAPLDPYTTKVPILLKDKTTVTAVRNDGRWSIEGRSEMPTSRKFDQLIAELNAAGFTRVGAKAKFGSDSKTKKIKDRYETLRFLKTEKLESLYSSTFNSRKILTNPKRLTQKDKDLMAYAIAVYENKEQNVDSQDTKTSSNNHDVSYVLTAYSRVGTKAKYGNRPLDTRGPFKPSGGPDADITGWSPKKDSPQRISETVASYKKMRDDYTKALARMTPEYLAKNPSAESYPRRMIREANDYIAKHDHARSGAKAKFGEVENLLNMISDQMNSGNNDLAKTNLRKLAAKIGEIRHTRSEWDQFMTVAKSLGFTESQIGGFSRRGSKMNRNGTKSKFESRQWESYFREDAAVTLWDANQLLKKIKDKKAELKQAEGNIAEGTAMLKTAVATQNTAQYYRANKILDIADGVRSSFSRTGTKSRFATEEEFKLRVGDTINLLKMWIKSIEKSLALDDYKVAKGVVVRAEQTLSQLHSLLSNPVTRFLRTGTKSINGVNSDPREFLDPKHFVRLFREEYLDAINGLLDDLDQPKMFLSDSASLSKIRDVLDDLQESADDAGIQLPSKVKEAYQTARRGRFSRTGAKATHAQVNIESHGVGSYYNSHLKEPKGTGSWSFIAPDGSILSAPGQMTLQAAKSWLQKNATINGYYKVAP